MIAVLTPAELWADDGCRDAMWRAFTAEERGDLVQRIPGILARGDRAPTGAPLARLLEWMGVSIWGQGAGPTATSVVPEYGLFPYQRGVVAHARTILWDSADRRTLLHLPTGSGKTRCAMHIVCHHLATAEPGLVVWLAGGPELLEQASEEFVSAWSALGNREVSSALFAGDADASPLRIVDGLVVAGLGKISELQKRDPVALRAFSEHVTLVVFDEAHQAIAPTYSTAVEMLSGMNPSCAVLGLTATPGRTWSDIAEDERLGDFWGRNIATMPAPPGYDSPVEYLIDEGYLARPSFQCMRLRAAPPVDPSAIVGESSDFSSFEVDRAAADGEFTTAVHTTTVELIEGGEHHRILVFAASVAHAHVLAVSLAATGHDAACVTGTTPDATRRLALERFTGNAPGPMVVVNFGVLTAGFDAPKVSAVVIARPTRSLVLFSQMVGRGTRGPKAGGTPFCQIVSVIPPSLPGFGDLAEAFSNWNDVYERPGDR